MTHWTAAERRWRDAIAAAMLPRHGALPGFAEHSAPDAFWARLGEVAPPLLRHGLRAATWAITWAPLPICGRQFHRLAPIDREAFLRRFDESRWFLVRQLVLAWKLVACLGLLTDPAVRARVDR